MSISQTVKKNISGLQVLKTLQVLLESDYTMAELISKLNEQEQEPIFNNSVISKYINTCRFCGINIPKIHNKYFVASLPFGLNLTDNDISLLDKLEAKVRTTMSNKPNNDFTNFLFTLRKFSNKQIMRMDEYSTQEIYEKFMGAISQTRKIKLMFKVKDIMECVPLGITEKKGKPHFHVLYKEEEKYIATDKISGLEIMQEKFQLDFSDRSIVYKIKGGLAYRYALRENETVVNQCLPDYIIISNSGEDKEALLSRLLRYDTCCEILYPKELRDEMKKMIDEMLNNYEV